MTTLITIHELQGLTDQELGELHQLFTILLSETVPHTADLRAILATLENIERAMGRTIRPASGIKP